ncbi:MAG: hypothetical protein KDE54_15120 [Caldilineaceae bacterium]|nr:hypothetical protein [Caldilineaceae bacterium]MCB0142200.1 hypothetical protein [Caldilineaceae bacterium]
MDARELEHRFTSSTVRNRPIDNATIGKLLAWRIIGSLAVVALFGFLVYIVNDIVIGAQREQFLREQSFAPGTADVKDVRAWMTLRLVSATFCVPESVLNAQLGIPSEQIEGEPTLGQLNSRYGFGMSEHGEYPAIVDKVQAAILAFRANPTPPGLAQIDAWMSIRYIAISTGVPENYLLAQTDIADPNAATQNLADLSVSIPYPGGVNGLVQTLQKVVTGYDESNSQ